MSDRTRNDDWGLAVELRGLIDDASEALLWLGDKNGHPPSRERNVDCALAAVRDRATEIEVHWNRRQANLVISRNASNDSSATD